MGAKQRSPGRVPGLGLRSLGRYCHARLIRGGSLARAR